MRPSGRTRRLRSALAVGLLALWVDDAAAQGAEQQLQNEPAPESVEDLKLSGDDQFEEAERRRPVLGLLGRPLERWLLEMPGVEDPTLRVQLRSYYLRRKRKDNGRTEAWTYGGSILLDSGWIRDRVALGGEFFFSQKLHAPSDRGGTLLLRPVQRPYRVLGQSYLKLRLAEDTTASIYRQTYELPYLNKRDNRMTPNTFEGYTLQGVVRDEDGDPRFDYIGGYVSRIKERNSDRFVPMGERASLVSDPKRGLWMGGVRWHGPLLGTLGAINLYTPDVFNTFYAVADRTWSLTDEISLRADLHYTDQRSVGDDLLTGSDFDTQQVAVALSASFKGGILRVAASTTDDEQRIRSPFGTPPTPLSMMVENFSQADEDAWLVGLSWNFRRFGLDGWSAVVNYARGNGARNDVGLRRGEEWELNTTLDYRIDAGRFRGLWFRIRGAFLREKGNGDSRNELRVIVRYDATLF